MFYCSDFIAPHITFIDNKEKNPKVYRVYLGQKATIGAELLDFDLTNNLDLTVYKITYETDLVKNISRPFMTNIKNLTFHVFPLNTRETLKGLQFTMDNIKEEEFGRYFLKIENRYSYDMFYFDLLQEGIENNNSIVKYFSFHE